MEELARRLAERLPVLQRIAVARTRHEGTPDRIPAFVNLFIEVMRTSTDSVGFVLPRRGDAARLTAVLYGLWRFSVTQGDLLKAYAESTFRKGDLVRINPSRHVYRFDGLSSDSPPMICLRTPHGGEQERWLVRAAGILPRLERTTLTRPMGRLNTPIHEPPPAALDVLLGTSSFGNQAIFRNEIALLDSRAGLEEFAKATGLLPTSGRDGASYSPIDSLLPLGDLQRPTTANPSWFGKWDTRNPMGEPILAVTHSAELVADWCSASPPRSRLIVANSLAVVKDLQSFDTICETQRLVAFTDDSERELAEVMASRGCLFWQLTAEELEVGHSSPASSRGVIGELRVWGCNMTSLVLDTEPCADEHLEAAALHLEALRDAIRPDEDSVLATLAGRGWRTLNDLAATARPLTGDEQVTATGRLERFRKDVEQSTAWLTPEQEGLLANAAEDLQRAVGSVGPSKGAALEKAVARSLDAANAPVLVARERQVADLTAWLRRNRRWASVRVHTPRSLREESALDHLICVVWPGTDTMGGLVSSHVAPHITVVGYAFERRWLTQADRRVRHHSWPFAIADAEKPRLVFGAGAEAGATPWSSHQSPDAPPSPSETPEEGIWDFEQRLRSARKGLGAAPTEGSDLLLARYVNFVGDSYAFLTETHRVVVVTDLLSRSSAQRQRLPERPPTDLRAGDFIVFPESGERGLIHEKADQLLGERAPQLRALAHLWKDALVRSGMSPEAFARQATELRRSRHIVTIRNWFAETAQIGPGLGNEDLSEDLELVSLVTEYEPLKSNLPAVMSAIKELRSAHLSAGARLRDVLIQRLPQVIGRVEEDGTMVDLGDLGSAWIVQVDSIAPDAELRGRGDVNRLLWDLRIPRLVF